MTVKELKEELSYYDDDGEVVFEVNDDFEPESITEDRYGLKSVHLDSKLKPSFICEIHGNCNIQLDVESEG